MVELNTVRNISGYKMLYIAIGLILIFTGIFFTCSIIIYDYFKEKENELQDKTAD